MDVFYNRIVVLDAQWYTFTKTRPTVHLKWGEFYEM